MALTLETRTSETQLACSIAGLLDTTAEDSKVPRIFLDGLEYDLDSQRSHQSTSPLLSASDTSRSSEAATPSLSEASLEDDDDSYTREPMESLDVMGTTRQIDFQTDSIELGFDDEIASDSQWRDGRLYIHSLDAEPTEQSQPFEVEDDPLLPSTTLPQTPSTPPTTLQDKLFEALQYSDHPERKRFFAKDTFKEIVHEQAVYDELRYYHRTLGPMDIRALARTICGTASCRKIFGLLTLVGKVADIRGFLHEGVTDDVLPFRKIFEPESPVFRLGRCVHPDTAVQPLRCFDGWNTSVLWMFEDWQWATLAPVFQGGERKNVSHIDLDGRTPLPFLYDSRYAVSSETIKGGYSTVFKVDIHPDHHTFRGIKTGHEQSFAVKCLTSIDESQFNQEVDMLSRFTDDAHPNLISLLATYKQLDKFYLIFPWADADLLSYWEHVNPMPQTDHNTVLWVGEQCLGIAQGLLGIHRHTTMAVTKHQGPENIPDKEIQIYGRHGDIKSSNILWFRSTDTSPTHKGVLKITDFGLAEFQSSASTIYKSPSQIAVSAGYRSPECDVRNGRVGPSHDVWALGCLYLEFITWLLGGWDLVQKFQKTREAKDLDECYGGSMDGKFFKITMGKDREPVASMKSSVVKFIDDLHRHQNCTSYVHEFLDLIQTRMLIIKSNDPQDVPRIGTGALTGKLKLLFSACKDAEFALAKVPRTKRFGK